MGINLVSPAEVHRVMRSDLTMAAKGFLLCLWAERDVADLDGKDVATTSPYHLVQQQEIGFGDAAFAAYTELHEKRYLVDTPDPRWGNSVVISLEPQQ